MGQGTKRGYWKRGCFAPARIPDSPPLIHPPALIPTFTPRPHLVLALGARPDHKAVGKELPQRLAVQLLHALFNLRHRSRRCTDIFSIHNGIFKKEMRAAVGLP